jgi:hypothetical protein
MGFFSSSSWIEQVFLLGYLGLWVMMVCLLVISVVGGA